MNGDMGQESAYQEFLRAIRKTEDLDEIDLVRGKVKLLYPNLAKLSIEQRRVLCPPEPTLTSVESLADDIVDIERHIYFREYGEALDLLRDVITFLSTHASVDVSNIVIDFNTLDGVEVQNSDNALVISALANIRKRNLADTVPLLEKLIKQFGPYQESFGYYYPLFKSPVLVSLDPYHVALCQLCKILLMLLFHLG